jgi:hypothetical protein
MSISRAESEQNIIETTLNELAHTGRIFKQLQLESKYVPLRPAFTTRSP